jgi:hypothetical protein
VRVGEVGGADDENDVRRRDFMRRCRLYDQEGRGVRSGGAGTGG